MVSFDVEVVSPIDSQRWKNAACFGSCHHWVSSPKYGNPKTVIHRISNYTETGRKYVSSLMNDLGLKRFFTDEAVQRAIESGEVHYIYKDYTSLLAVMTPFRYFEESPKHVDIYLHLISLGAEPIYAFAAIHYITTDRGKQIPEGHSAYNPRKPVNKKSIDGYLDRLEDSNYTSCMEKWCTYRGKRDLFDFQDGGDYNKYSLTYEHVLETLTLTQKETPTVAPTKPEVKLVLRQPAYKT